MKLCSAFVAATFAAGAALAAEPLPKADLAKGQKIASEVCAACHGADGNSIGPANPKLASQIPEYLAKQLMNFRPGADNKPAERPNNVMAAFATTLSPEDVRSVAAFYAGQKLDSGEGAGQEHDRAGPADLPRRHRREERPRLRRLPRSERHRRSRAVPAARRSVRRVHRGAAESVPQRRARERSEPDDADDRRAALGCRDQGGRELHRGPPLGRTPRTPVGGGTMSHARPARAVGGITLPSTTFTGSRTHGAGMRIALGVSATLLGGCTFFALMQVPVKRESGALVDAEGMTLYTFDRDTYWSSACNAQCAVDWPPLVAAPRREAGGRLHDHRPRRRPPPVGVQGQAALRLGEGPEAGRPDGRSVRQRLARGASLRLERERDTDVNPERIAEHIPRLRRYARALVGDQYAADDLVQDTLERAINKRHLWRPGSDLRAWLFAIMHNVFVNQLRSRRAHPEEALDDDALPAVMPVDGVQLEIRDLQTALAALPPEQRAVVLLVGLEQLTYAEVSEALGIPIGTVMSRLFRGRERLRGMLTGAPALPGLKVVK